MKSIDNYSDDELKAELDRREKKKKSPPKQIENCTFEKTKKVVEDMINITLQEESLVKDFEYWVFESFMSELYGKDIWEWYNQYVR